MKICPNCQTSDNDDTLKFCLQCGIPLPESQQAYRTGGNGVIATAILGGFLLLTMVVGGLGIYFFSRSDNKAQSDLVNSQNNRHESNERVSVVNNQKPLVEQLNVNKQSAPSTANALNSHNSSNKTLPRIVTSSSSARKPETGNFYFPNFAFDNNPETAWCEGARGAGQGEWLQFNFDREVTLKAIKIQPGYFKNDEAWRKNNRVARISVKFSDDSTRAFSLSDEKKTQTLDVGEMQTNSVKITIEDYFAGTSESEDTLISEVSFITEP